MSTHPVSKVVRIRLKTNRMMGRRPTLNNVRAVVRLRAEAATAHEQDDSDVFQCLRIQQTATMAA